MPIKDSIQVLSDSARLAMDSLAQRDSVLLADSIARADSVARADSIALHAFKGYEGVIATGAPSDQNWVFLVLFFMFSLVVVAFLRAISSPLDVFKSFFNSGERTSIFTKTSIDNFEQKVYFFLFTITAFALLGYLLFYVPPQVFSFLKFLYFVVAVVLFFIVKYILTKFISYVFLDKNITKTVTDSYLHIITFIAALFYPLMLVHLYTYQATANFTTDIALVIIALGLIFFSIKLVQIFLQKIVSSLYILLYLCTLEILPLIGLFFVFRFIATHV